MAVVTTGFFDGVHLGHRAVIKALVSSARERGEEAIVVTFWPHPRTVLQQDAREFRILTTLDEKKALLASLGVDRVEVISNAMDLRGFGKHKKRTWYAFKPLGKNDAAAIAVCAVIALAALAVSIFIDHGRYWNPFAI